MSRLPIRVRLTIIFALAMAAVLAAVGAFVYLRLGNSLGEQIDDGLEARALTLAALVRGGSEDIPLGGGDDEFGQILGADGTVLAATPGVAPTGLPGPSFLTPDELTRARAGQITVEREVSRPVEPDTEAHFLATPVDGTVLVVGASLEERNEALDGLLSQLLIGGPVALLLASGAAYLLAGAALRPVESMRARAGEISAETAGRRLPLPESRDEIFRLGETLNAMLARLDEGLRRERRFVADAGHELRTPLALLQTELELALRHPRTHEEFESALRSASEEVDRLTRLAEDLLVLASSEEGTLPLRSSEFFVQELLDGVARRFGARAAEEGRALEVDVQANNQVQGDRLRLEQALGNLVDNALRHGGGSVRLVAERNGDDLVLRVSDEGAGFPPEFLPRAFERFSRADEARTRGGAGLGLAIVAAVAQAHGGSARANGADGGGASVEIRLPDSS